MRVKHEWSLEDLLTSVHVSCVPLQLPSYPVHREPLQCPPAKEDGPVPGGDPGGQTRPGPRQA